MHHPNGLGAVLSHITSNGERPIAYASRMLTPTERNYSQIEREGLAIIFGLRKFHQYLYGRIFTLITDSKPLSYILGPRKGIQVLAAARIQRWAIQLAAYDYDIELCRSSDNGNADALSRLPLPDCDSDASDKLVNWTQEATAFNMHPVNSLPVTAKSVVKESLHDVVLARALYYTRNGWPDSEDIAQEELKPFHSRQREFSIEEGCLLWGARVVIPSRYRIQILEELHGGHPGIVRMKGLARLHVWWPNIDQDIENTAQGCSACQATQPMPTRAEGNPWIWPSGPWKRVHVDFAGPFLGQMYLIMIDAYSKWTEVPPMKSVTTMNTIEIMRRVFAQHGVCVELVSDNGRQFVAEEFKEFMTQNGVKHILIPAYHPSSNGQAENTNDSPNENVGNHPSPVPESDLQTTFLANDPQDIIQEEDRRFVPPRRSQRIMERIRPNDLFA
ncbi:uncharacterized protein K02A2.6-like [Macrobrachium nipponense]|uniref:uncharacterized protein K02A2.6-like n=1 Tax=Macrobrachium nipponense TaxID=159736 RepID=UPI0030C8CE48